MNLYFFLFASLVTSVAALNTPKPNLCFWIFGFLLSIFQQGTGVENTYLYPPIPYLPVPTPTATYPNPLPPLPTLLTPTHPSPYLPYPPHPYPPPPLPTPTHPHPYLPLPTPTPTYPNPPPPLPTPTPTYPTHPQPYPPHPNLPTPTPAHPHPPPPLPTSTNPHPTYPYPPLNNFFIANEHRSLGTIFHIVAKSWHGGTGTMEDCSLDYYYYTHVWCRVVWFTCQGIITLCLGMPKIPFYDVQMSQRGTLI